MAAPDQNRDPAADDNVESGTSPTSSLPTAVVVDAAPAPPPDPARWLRRGILLSILAIGWLFILWQNRFYFTAPSVFVCLAYLAVVSTGYALWRTGVVVVAEDIDGGDATWGRPIGRRSELEREKKTLLKAIKEAEFDREMGKLSKADSEEMIAVYRVRAIEVIKEIDQMDAGSAGTVREQIERELKARLELDTKATKAKADAIADAAKDKKAKKDGSAKADAKADAKAEKAKKAPATTATEAASASADDERANDSPTTDDNLAAAKADDESTTAKEATS
jgi:hypothetical protein